MNGFGPESRVAVAHCRRCRRLGARSLRFACEACCQVAHGDSLPVVVWHSQPEFAIGHLAVALWLFRVLALAQCSAS